MLLFVYYRKILERARYISSNLETTGESERRSTQETERSQSSGDLFNFLYKLVTALLWWLAFLTVFFFLIG